MASNLQFALASAQAETKLALAQFNFDFSLFRREAPIEYHGVGTHISAKRRDAAEVGTIHKTAQRLSVLFQSTLPKTPALIKVYGLRSSEISKQLDSTPKPRGVFKDYVGLDATSLYAAATSSDTALAIHLLACFLARLFEARDAVAIWEELIASHKATLLGDTSVVDIERAAIAAIQIRHDQLQEWDNSARAWLSAADKLPELAKKQTQLTLIVNNIGHIQVDRQSSPYESVLAVWKTALETMNRIVGGASYAITDGAVLTAVSAWHLYPDMYVSGSPGKHIKQHDELLPQAGRLSVGFKSKSLSDPGVHWSLPLSHLRFYGPPVLASGSWKIIPKRLSFEQFLYAMLGCTFRGWNVAPEDFELCTRLIVLCAKCCFDTPLSELGSLIRSCDPGLRWFAPLAHAANAYQQSKVEHRNQIDRLLRMGYKRPSPMLDMQNLRKSSYGILFMREFHFFDWIADHTVWLRVMRQVLQNMPVSHSQGLIVRVMQSGDDVISEQLECLYPRWSTAEGKKLLMRWIVNDKNVTPTVQDEQDLLEQSIDSTDVTWSPAFNSLAWKNCPVSLIEPALNCSNLSTDQISSNPDWWLGQVSSSSMADPASEVRYDLLLGNLDTIALFAQRNSQSVTRRILNEHNPSLKDLISLLESNTCDPQRVRSHFSVLSQVDGFPRALHVLGFLTQLYVYLPEATVATSIFDQGSFCLDRFFHEIILAPDIGHKGYPWTSKRRQLALRIIGSLELGQPVDSILPNTFAICAHDSIYIAKELFADPCEQDNDCYIRRIFGNIGEAGLVFLVEPAEPQMRKAKAEEWSVVSHDPFDNRWEDSFAGTSLHLRFTGWKMPLVGEIDSGTRFTNTNAIEAVVSVYDTGVWVGDLDLEHYLRYDWEEWILMVTCHCTIPGSASTDGTYADSLVCIDTWSELLDTPLAPAVVRAHGNSEARLATSIVSRMRGHPTVVFGRAKCWTCARSLLEEHQYVRSAQAIEDAQTADQVDDYSTPVADYDVDGDEESERESANRKSEISDDDDFFPEEKLPIFIL